jgi:hypothetical protein
MLLISAFTCNHQTKPAQPSEQLISLRIRWLSETQPVPLNNPCGRNSSVNTMSIRATASLY